MKYIIVLGDGMADEPIESLGGKTPLEYACTPMMDELSKHSELGLSHTIPEGMSPGSDTANLAVLGYDPRKYYTGRSPLEALSIGVPMKDTDIALRCNVVTLSENCKFSQDDKSSQDGKSSPDHNSSQEYSYEERTIIDHSAGEITTEEAAVLIEAVREALENDQYKFYPGTSYRHLTIWDKGEVVSLTPPHDILSKRIGEYLPKEDTLRKMMEKSYEILNNHPINLEREKRGLNKANSIWFWGAGTKPALDSFEEKTGKTGVMISAVDLLKGIAVGAGMKNIDVEGADGTLHTNYEGKAKAAVKALTEDGYDFAYIHVEAPDEMGHQGNLSNKIKAIENLDQRVIRIVKEEMDRSGTDYRLLIMPDHPTPIACRTHTSDPVPYLLFDSTVDRNENWSYNEKDGKLSGNFIEEGYKLMEKFILA